jgi:hypothetical protein
MLLDLIHRYTLLDILLIVILCILLPTLRMTRHLWGAQVKIGETLPRIYFNLALIGFPLALLAWDWAMAGRSVRELGLAVPVPLRGQIGFVVAGAIIVVLLIRARAQTLKRNPQKAATRCAQLEDAGMLMHTPAELRAIGALAFVQGFGAGIPFRGFLLWGLVPIAGIAGAVVIAATAYGIGHGSRSWERVLVSSLTAYAFTIAYAVTHSLWWLMLLHTFVLAHNAWRGYRLSQEVVPRTEEIALVPGDGL